jgi:drug/metabolite transporter (DMT)-like permease
MPQAKGGATGERLGVLAAVLSSSVGGTNTAVTRFAIGDTDPITLAALRFGLGFVLLMPLALVLRSRWPRRRDWIGVALLGVLFFAVFMGLFNLSLKYTTAARGALALSVLPLVTMAVGAALRVEALGARKAIGVLVAIAGVAMALVTGLADAPAGAWRGDAVMIAAVFCFALYNVWSRPFIARSDSLSFVAAGMGAGAGCMAPLAWAGGGVSAAGGFDWPQWAAIIYLGVFGAALTFFLWVLALARTTPTRVATTITLNPVTAAVVAAMLLGEPIGLDLIVGIAAVFAGIWLASTEGRDSHRPPGLARRMLARIGRILSARRTARELAELDDRRLRDVGLRRCGGRYVENRGRDIVAPMSPPSATYLDAIGGPDAIDAAGSGADLSAQSEASSTSVIARAPPMMAANREDDCGRMRATKKRPAASFAR